MKKISYFLVLCLIVVACLPSNANCNCTCKKSSNSSDVIGSEYVAKRCPIGGDDDNTLFTYAARDIRCQNNAFLYYNFREVEQTPKAIESLSSWYNFRVLRNPSGTHFIVVHGYFKGKVAGIDVTNLSAGVYTYESLNSYCYTAGEVIDSDSDGWPNCFDCNDNDPDHTSECPLPVVEEKNLGYHPCKYHTFAGNPVNIATGNKYQKEIDIKPGSTPMALQFVRHYNSRSSVNRSLGFGWSHTYDRYLTFSDGKILCHREDGRVIYFSSDTLEAESGAREKLVERFLNSISMS
ncbi:MAG TPA: hypothetical protein ENI41_04080 [Deltaproteobacteria bacterium]|nr:hypothetical protein [Deltaproteobacteria bacterium]